MKYNKLYQIEGRFTRLYMMIRNELLMFTFKSPERVEVNWATGKHEIFGIVNWFNTRNDRGHVSEISFDELSDTHRHEIIEEVFWDG